MSLYWIDRLDYLSNSLIGVIVICFLCLAMAPMVYMEDQCNIMKYIITICIIIAISILGVIFVPTSDQYKSYYNSTEQVKCIR